ncbi:hypothetical protein [Winogradskya humida]|nr:hypothetical protein [Actinoplanes humidus]
MINPGTQPVEGAREKLAATALAAFLTAVRERAAELEQVPIRHRVAGVDGEPVRTPATDRDGRFGWDVPISDSTTVPILIPGVEVARMRDDMSAHAPCLYVDGIPAWWGTAIGSLANVGMKLTPGAAGTASA